MAEVGKVRRHLDADVTKVARDQDPHAQSRFLSRVARRPPPLATFEMRREVATLGAERTTSRHSPQVGDIATERGRGPFAVCFLVTMSAWPAIRK
jgi:hypothetical protein